MLECTLIINKPPTHYRDNFTHTVEPHIKTASALKAPQF